MSKTIALPALWLPAAAFLLAAPGVCRAGETPRPPRRGEAVAVMLEKGPRIDGTMEDPLWGKCPPWPLGACTSEQPQKHKTWAKVLFDSTHIYVGVYCEEPETKALAARVAERDGPVWDDDSVEVFLRPDAAQPACQFVVNPRGTLYDARDKQPAWNSSAKVRAAIQEGTSWTVTLAIPLKELPTYVGDDQAWTMNIYRTRPARAGDPTLMYSWSIMHEPDYHATAEFGVLTGIDVPQRADGVTRVREGGVARPLVRERGVEAGGVTVYRQIDFDHSLTGATVYPHCARAAFGTLTVSALGYPSMRTSFARDKVREILRQENPEFMFILYGTNNDKAETHLPAAMDDLTAVVAACETHGTVAVLGTIPPRGWTPESAPEVNFNRQEVELCGKQKIPAGYIFEAFQEAGPQNRRTYMGGDGVHWTGEGMALGGRAWGKTLEQIRFVLRDQK